MSNKWLNLGNKCAKFEIKAKQKVIKYVVILQQLDI
jgi:hypothetical protein